MDSCDSTGRSRKYGANMAGKNVQLCVKIPLRIWKWLVTIQDSPKHKLLRAYDSDLGVQNPIGEADFHGFCICNCEGTEQLQ